MFLTILKEIEDCLKLNKSLKENNLVKLTWGNASVLSEDGKHVVIKPSGVDFDKIKFSDLCIIELYTGKLVSGMKPSVDTAIHLEIYKAFPEDKSFMIIYGFLFVLLQMMPCLSKGKFMLLLNQQQLFVNVCFFVSHILCIIARFAQGLVAAAI